MVAIIAVFTVVTNIFYIKPLWYNKVGTVTEYAQHRPDSFSAFSPLLIPVTHPG